MSFLGKLPFSKANFLSRKEQKLYLSNPTENSRFVETVNPLERQIPS